MRLMRWQPARSEVTLPLRKATSLRQRRHHLQDRIRLTRSDAPTTLCLFQNSNPDPARGSRLILTLPSRSFVPEHTPITARPTPTTARPTHTHTHTHTYTHTHALDSTRLYGRRSPHCRPHLSRLSMRKPRLRRLPVALANMRG